MHDARRTELNVIGMRGNECRERVAMVLSGVDGVHDVDVSLFRGKAVVHHSGDLDPGVLIQKVSEAGYGASMT